MRRKVAVGLIFGLVLFSVSAAQAQIIPFGDSSIYWPGWSSPDSVDNTKDTIGIPNLTGGDATIDGGMLSILNFYRSDPKTVSYWNVLSPGDLFIDIGANQTWDYVVDLTSWTVAGKANPDALAGNYQIYSVNWSLSDGTKYIKSGTDNTNGWSGYEIRDGHPVAGNIAWTTGGDVGFSGWDMGTTTAWTYTFNFAALNNGLGLDLGTSGAFIIGWGENCANDVIYEKVEYPPVPEPASLSLLGLGLLGLIGLRKKRS